MIVLWFWRTFCQNQINLILSKFPLVIYMFLLSCVSPGLGVVSLHLLDHGDAVLAPPELVIELGVMERQGYEDSELRDEDLVILIIQLSSK